MENMTYEEMMAVREAGCSQCVFMGWGHIAGQRDKVGVCRRNPPTTTSQDMNFPGVCADDWCGSFVKMPEKRLK